MAKARNKAEVGDIKKVEAEVEDKKGKGKEG
jgi:hypothetical protein